MFKIQRLHPLAKQTFISSVGTSYYIFIAFYSKTRRLSYKIQNKTKNSRKFQLSINLINQNTLKIICININTYSLLLITVTFSGELNSTLIESTAEGLSRFFFFQFVGSI